MVALLLFACTGPNDGEVDDSPADSLVDSSVDSPAPDTAVVRPTLVNPAEAVDLDDADGVVRFQLAASATETGFAYNGQVPGPTLRAELGDTVVIEFQNDLDNPTTLHWHGLHVPFDMDGVTWMGAPIEPGGSFTYTFTVEQVGTYWYHPHFDTESQMDLGLYGVFIVDDPAAPEMDELVVVFDAGDEVATDDHHHPEGTRLEWTVNGVRDGLYEGDGPLRVRALNVSNTGYVALRSPGRRIASDQGWIQHDTLDMLVLGPGDRAELEWNQDTEVMAAPYTLNGGEALGDDVRLFSAQGLAGEPASWPEADAQPTPDPGTTDIVYVFQGGPQGWLINGETFPDVTIEEIRVGEPTVVEVRNLSPSHHPFHLHGMGFELLSMNGVPPATKTVEDNLDIPLYSTARVLVHPTRAGDWMAHCHILPHADGGMMTVLRVVE